MMYQKEMFLTKIIISLSKQVLHVNKYMRFDVFFEFYVRFINIHAMTFLMVLKINYLYLKESIFPFYEVAERFYEQNWQTGGTRFSLRLSTQSIGIFVVFLRTSGKYVLGSIIKTPKEGTPQSRLGPSEAVGLKTYNPKHFIKFIKPILKGVLNN